MLASYMQQIGSEAFHNLTSNIFLGIEFWKMVFKFQLKTQNI